ncbi:MAG: VOC family protein [Fusobacteriaceae bacterium]|jgi:lactoylglutathione lyase|nr:VOC family protein [Fusobacteriaceae bacterium]
MKFSHVTIHAKAFEKSVAFYRDIVGLPIARTVPADAPLEKARIAFMGDGETVVELIRQAAPAEPVVAVNITIGFLVPGDIAAWKAELAAGGFEIIEPETLPPNVIFFYIKDPDGVLVQFYRYR